MKKILYFIVTLILVVAIVFNVYYIISLNRTLNFYKNQSHQNLIQQEQTTDEVGQPITKEQAITIALNHANVPRESVSFLRATQEIDDIVSLIEVDFHVGLVEYNYDINANTGEIIEFDMD